jgi:hypothetical protein
VRWFAILKTRRFIHITARADGMRLRIEGEVLVVNRGPESAEQMPKSVVGSAKLEKSEAVKRYSVCMWYNALLKSLLGVGAIETSFSDTGNDILVGDTGF